MVWARAGDLGLVGDETKERIDQDAGLLSLLDEIRGKATALLRPGYDWRSVDAATTPGLPLIGLVSPPVGYRTLSGGTVRAGEMDVRIHLVFRNQLHESIAGTASVSLAAASRVPGSVVAALAGCREPDRLFIGHPSGVTPVRVRSTPAAEPPYVHFDLLGFSRTARRVMDGTAYYPKSALLRDPRAGRTPDAQPQGTRPAGSRP